MIVDSSALVAIVFQEPGFQAALDKLEAAESSGIGAPTAVETGLVLGHRLRQDPRALLDRLLTELHITEISFGPQHRAEALRAYWRFGRGRHSAGLNFGDCLSYAVASRAAEPLLFTGDDFRATDIAPA